jgi:hypothetical protein
MSPPGAQNGDSSLPNAQTVWREHLAGPADIGAAASAEAGKNESIF